MRELTASDRDSLIKLASSLPKGDETRKAILAGLSVSKTAHFNPTLNMFSEIALALGKLGSREADQLVKYTHQLQEVLAYRDKLNKELSENKKDRMSCLTILQSILNAADSNVEVGPLKDKIDEAYAVTVQLRDSLFKE